MEYYIFQNGKLKKADSTNYERWQTDEWPEHKLPDLIFKEGKTRFIIETLFYGAFDKGDGIYPFVVLFFEDEWLDEAGESKLNRDHSTEYFATYDEFVNYYELLKKQLEARVLQHGS